MPKSTNVPYHQANIKKGSTITKSVLRDSIAKGGSAASSKSRETSQG